MRPKAAPVSSTYGSQVHHVSIFGNMSLGGQLPMSVADVAFAPCRHCVDVVKVFAIA
jgi:hypothetical protein